MASDKEQETTLFEREDPKPRKIGAPYGNKNAVGRRANGQGGPVGNVKALKHGLFSLRKAYKSGKIQHLRGVPKVTETIKAGIVRDLGGDPSTQQRIAVDELAKMLVYAHAIDARLFDDEMPELDALRWLDERRRISEAIGKHLKLLGMKRVEVQEIDLAAQWAREKREREARDEQE